MASPVIVLRPDAPLSGLAAISDLVVQVTDLKELANNTLGSRPRLYNRLKTFFNPTYLPCTIDQVVANVRALAMRSVKEKVFLQSDGERIDQVRIDVTYETVSKDFFPIIM